MANDKRTGGPAKETIWDRIRAGKEKTVDEKFINNPVFSTMQDMLGADWKDLEDMINQMAGPRPIESDVYTEDMNKVLTSLREQEKGMDPRVKQIELDKQRQDLASAARAGGAGSGMKGRSFENKQTQDRFAATMSQAGAIQAMDIKEQELKDAASAQILELDTQLKMKLRDEQDDFDRYRNELMMRFSQIYGMEAPKVGG